jgi:AcrR family transcriptional regulator
MRRGVKSAKVGVKKGESSMETTGSLRARKKAATEAALQDAALALFVEKGYDQTTIEEIVREADVSRRTFFRYFGSKEEVIFKGADTDLVVLSRLVSERPPEEPDLQTIKQAVLGFVRYLEARAAPVLTFINVIVASPTLRARGAELQGRWTTNLAEALAARAGGSVAIKHRLLSALAMAALAAGISTRTDRPNSDLEDEVGNAFACIEDGSLLR